MKLSPSTIIKICLFVVLGVIFGGSLVFYSHGRGQVHETGDDASMFFSHGETKTRHIEKKFTVNSGGNFNLETDAGEVFVDTWDTDEVQIVVDIEGNDKRTQKFDVQFFQEGNTIKVVGKIKDHSFFKWNIGDLDVKYTITLPKKFSVTANTSGGNLKVRNVTGEVRCETSGGDVTAESIDGQTILNTSGGGIEANLIKGNVKVETSGGDIRANDITGDFKGNTSGGNINLNTIDGNVYAETSGGDIDLRVKGENKGISVHTSGGGITIHVKENIAADVDASTSGGSVKCELPITIKGTIEESELHGRINGGGNSIRAETSGGDIRIVTLKNEK